MNEIKELLIPLLATLLTYLATYLGIKLKELIDAKITKERQEQIANIVDATVKYVEQIANRQGFVGDKYNLAKQRILDELTIKGLEISEEYLDSLIEAFVRQLEIEGE